MERHIAVSFLLLFSFSKVFAGRPPFPVAITGFSPSVVAPGQKVKLLGQSLNQVSSASMNGVVFPSANINRVSAGELILLIPSNVRSGPITVKDQSGREVSSSAILKIEPFCNPKIVASNVLAINDLSIVNHAQTVFKAGDLANSRWSFGYLMGRIAGFAPSQAKTDDFQIQTSKFISNWLNSFQCDPKTSASVCDSNIKAPNGNSVAGRDITSIVNQWPKKRIAGQDIFDLAKAPFRLLSIMSRIDLRNANQAGEGRFVFGVTDPNGSALQFTVILEYSLPLSASDLNLTNSLADWSKRWAQLANFSLGSPEYQTALLRVTDAFSNARFTSRPNSSAINQVRSNEITLGFPWQLREWNLAKKLDSDSLFQLLPATVKQTPHQQLNNTAALANWAQANREGILNSSILLKDADTILFQGKNRPILSASAEVDGSWQLPGVSEELRKAFAVNMTCNGCHSSETLTKFTHVSPRQLNESASFSVFLTNELTARNSDIKGVLINQFCK